MFNNPMPTTLNQTSIETYFQHMIRKDGRYIRYMPMIWVEKTITLPGKAFQVATAMWFFKSVHKSNKFELCQDTLRTIFNVQKDAVYRALKSLENAGVIAVERQQGRTSIVQILTPYNQLRTRRNNVK